MTPTKVTSSAGPRVHGQPTQVAIYNPVQLSQYPFLEQVKDMINASFSRIFAPYNNRLRLENKEQYVEGLTQDSFTCLLCSQSSNPLLEPTIHAVGTVRRFQANPTSPNVWAYVHAPDADLRGVEQWELKSLAVNLLAQRHGLGAYVLHMLEDTVVDRFKEEREEALVQGRRPSECQMVMTALKEGSLPFYLKHGYDIDFERPVAQSERYSQAFHVVSMSKTLWNGQEQ